MNILQLIERKSVTYLFLFLFFLFLCVLSQEDSTFVGIGFGVLCLMSLLTKNIVFCVAGSFMVTFIIAFVQNTKEGVLFGDRCNSTCFDQNQKISKTNDDLQDNIKSLKNEINVNQIENTRLNQENTSMNIKNTNLFEENTRLFEKNIQINNKNKRLKSRNMQLAELKQRYRGLVDTIFKISSS